LRKGAVDLMFKSYANGAAAAFAIMLFFVIVSVKIDWVYYVVVFVFDFKVPGVSTAASSFKPTFCFG
jgi:hypothetical protein